VRPEGTRNGNRSEVQCGWTRGCTGEPRDGIHSMGVESRDLAIGSGRLKYLVGDSSEQRSNLWLINVIQRLQSVEIHFNSPLSSKESLNRRVTLCRQKGRLRRTVRNVRHIRMFKDGEGLVLRQ